MIDRPQGGELAVLVHVFFPADSMQEDLHEFEELAHSAGAKVAAVVTGSRSVPEARYFIGSGKAEEIRAVVVAHQAQLVLFNHALTPAQERNLEKLFQCRVLDRTGLILDIFAQRARSFEGKLQVELALLKHLSTRLIRGWTHLERQRGGIGLRGPGETQLETDRRLIKKRIQLIMERLVKVKKQRDQSRRARRRAAIPTVALVGYTNAGKSTLFNRLCNADVLVANQLFATLDPTLRRLSLPEIGPVIFADTVGFIRHLPHDLVEAFHATLEEVIAADLLLHVVDVHDARRSENKKQVNAVLTSIGAGSVPQLLVYNKIDLEKDAKARIELDQAGHIFRVRVSAKDNSGIDDLQHAIVERLSKEIVSCSIILKPTEARLRAELYQLDAVTAEEIDEEGCYHLSLRLPKAEWERLSHRVGATGRSP